jgi:16S rRNA A1518/A1519 N6-dimethyltransferase RsmA/KsgA/DIM1 with predicted DNA glycosylase/AP lyase activity
MGICADYIQAQGVNSHTIVEIHPQIIDKLKIWAEDKPNVTIVEGDWHSVEGLYTYDGIFLDTFGDDNFFNFKNFAYQKQKIMEG